MNLGEMAPPILQSFPILESYTVKQPWLPTVFKEFTHAGLLGGPKLPWCGREKESEVM